ncbi:MAG: ribosome maturation factor RimM [Acidobacteriota bacterium]
MATDELILVGRVARPHGIRGQVIVNPDTDFMDDRFKVGQLQQVGPADRTVEREIAAVRFHQGRPIVSFAGIETMDDAESLAGAELWMPQSALAPLPDGTFYRHDLVGCEVRDTDDALVGCVTAVEGTLERSYLVVDGDVMIPLVEHICVSVDLPARRVTVSPPEGLIELYRAGKS